MKKRTGARAAWILMALLALSGCASGRAPSLPEPELVLTIATADSGGTMYPVGSAIAGVLEQEGVTVNVSASSGSAMNAQSLVSGEVDLALVSGDIALAALEEQEGGSLRAVAAVFFSQSNWMSPEDLGFSYVHDLAGEPLGVGPEHSTTEWSALTALECAGLDPEGERLSNCGLGAGTGKVEAGELSAIHGFSGAPIGALAQLARAVPCRVLKYTPEELDAILEANSAFVPVTLPAGTYPGQTEAVDTFGVKCLLCVDESMDGDLAYRLTRTLWENREALAEAHPALAALTEPGFMAEELPIPLHGGAERFYAEQS